jgi:hypothetical protein
MPARLDDDGIGIHGIGRFFVTPELTLAGKVEYVFRDDLEDEAVLGFDVDYRVLPALSAFLSYDIYDEIDNDLLMVAHACTSDDERDYSVMKEGGVSLPLCWPVFGNALQDQTRARRTRLRRWDATGRKLCVPASGSVRDHNVFGKVRLVVVWVRLVAWNCGQCTGSAEVAARKVFE